MFSKVDVGIVESTATRVLLVAKRRVAEMTKEKL